MNRSKNQWQDHYTRRAQKENYAARSVYKLAEIQKKYRIIRKGDAVLDLGCSPGSWLQFAAEQTGSAGRVAGVDLKPVAIQLPAHVTNVCRRYLSDAERVCPSSARSDTRWCSAIWRRPPPAISSPMGCAPTSCAGQPWLCPGSCFCPADDLCVKFFKARISKPFVIR